MAKVAGCQRDNTLSKKEKQSTEVFGAVPSKLMPKHPVASLLSCCLGRAVSSAVSMILSSAQFHVLSTFYGQKYLSQTELPGILHPPLNSGISGFGVGWAELLCCSHQWLQIQQLLWARVICGDRMSSICAVKHLQDQILQHAVLIVLNLILSWQNPL